jgi:subtilisin family serine protease
MKRRFAVVVAVVSVLVSGVGVAAPVGAASTGKQTYLVQFVDGATADEARSTVSSAGGGVRSSWSNVGVGVAAEMTSAAAAGLARNPRVAIVEPDGVVTVSNTRAAASWGLDRIDQRFLPLSGTVTAAQSGAGVLAYVVDTGVRPNHPDFGGRVSAGFTAINDGWGSNDCHWHGTHVAGTVAGASYGVATQATIVPVRVLGCDGSGTWSQVISGLDWIAGNHPVGTPGVVNMSLGGGASSVVDDAVKRVIAKNITTVVAAGNEGADACTKSPARVPDAITVAATNRSDARTSWSNWGSCVDVFAPGDAIVSTYLSSGTYTASGTSMASPHVAGVAALLAAQQPTATVATITGGITGAATTGVVTSTNGTVNLLLFIPDGTTQETVTLAAPTNLKASAQKARVTVSWVSPAGAENVTVTLSNSSRTYRTTVAATTTSVVFSSVIKGTYTVSAVATKGTITSSAATTSVTVK